MKEKLNQIQKIDRIIDKYLESDEICPDKFIRLYYSNPSLTKNAFKNYAISNEENYKKYKLFANAYEERKEKFILIVEKIVKLMREKTITPLVIELISKMTLNSFRTAINKDFIHIIFGHNATLLRDICKNSNDREVSLDDALNIKFTYKNSKMQKEDIIKCIDYLRENDVIVSIPNITFAYQKMINGELNYNKVNKL